MSQKFPAQLVLVAAVGWIGEEPLLQVSEQHLKELVLWRKEELGENALFECDNQLFLLPGRTGGKGCPMPRPGSAVKCCQSKPIEIHLLPVRSRQRAVQIDTGADRAGTGSRIVSGEEPLEYGRDGSCLVRSECQQSRHLHLNVPSAALLLRKDTLPAVLP